MVSFEKNGVSLYTDEQKKIIESSGSNITLVKAYAGTGKSFTLKEYCLKRANSKIIYFVYNKNMETEAKSSFRNMPWVEVVTFHGVGYKKIGYRYKDRLSLGEITAVDLIDYVFDIVTEENQILYASGLLKLLQEFCVSMDTMKEFIIKKRKENIQWSTNNLISLSKIINLLPILWEDVTSHSSLPMSHDIYLKMFQLSNMRLEFDYILVDEAQDLNPVMIDIILREEKGKKVFVGDSYQSIYQWRGALDSLQYIENNFACDVFYLSKSFRCSPEIAELGNRVIKKIGALKEFVGCGGNEVKINNSKFTYIARTNSQIFKFCVDNLDKKIHFVGGFSKYNFYEMLDVKRLQSKQHNKIVSPFIKQFKGIKELAEYASKTNDVALRGLIGIVMSYDSEYGIYDLISKIKDASTTSSSLADFSIVTAHRSKGLEWENVHLLEDFPFFKEKFDSSKVSIEEYNLLYVAITRAKNNLVLSDNFFDFFHS